MCQMKQKHFLSPTEVIRVNKKNLDSLSTKKFDFVVSACDCRGRCRAVATWTNWQSWKTFKWKHSIDRRSRLDTLCIIEWPLQNENRKKKTSQRLETSSKRIIAHLAIEEPTDFNEKFILKKVLLRFDFTKVAFVLFVFLLFSRRHRRPLEALNKDREREKKVSHAWNIISL